MQKRRARLEKMRALDRHDREVREKSDERVQKTERKEQEATCKRKIQTIRAWKKHKEAAKKKNKKPTKVWTIGNKVFDTVPLKTHAESGFVNRKKSFKNPVHKSSHIEKSEDICGCKLGVEGLASHVKYGPPRCMKGHTTNRFEAERCRDEQKYCRPLSKTDACACKLGSEGYSSRKQRCEPGALTNYREARLCLAWRHCKRPKKTAASKRKVRSAKQCSGWSPKAGRWKGEGAKCAKGTWIMKWCYVNPDYDGPGHQFKKKSENPCRYYAPCK